MRALPLSASPSAHPQASPVAIQNRCRSSRSCVFLPTTARQTKQAASTVVTHIQRFRPCFDPARRERCILVADFVGTRRCDPRIGGSSSEILGRAHERGPSWKAVRRPEDLKTGRSVVLRCCPSLRALQTLAPKTRIGPLRPIAQHNLRRTECLRGVASPRVPEALVRQPQMSKEKFCRLLPFGSPAGRQEIPMSVILTSDSNSERKSASGPVRRRPPGSRIYVQRCHCDQYQYDTKNLRPRQFFI